MEERDEVSRHWFDAGRVKLEIVEDVSMFFDDEALVALSGAPSDSTVTVSVVRDVQGEFDGIRLQIHHPCVFSMSRFIRRSFAGEWYIHNAKFRIRHEFAGRQFAARNLAIQARAAQELGFKRIVLDAVGDHFLAGSKYPDDRWVGYWVWPRLGFDASLSEGVLRHLPEAFRNCKQVSEVISSKEGEDAWFLYGDTLNDATFDLTADSTSWQLLAKYLQQRKIRV